MEKEKLNELVENLLYGTISAKIAAAKIARSDRASFNEVAAEIIRKRAIAEDTIVTANEAMRALVLYGVKKNEAATIKSTILSEFDDKLAKDIRDGKFNPNTNPEFSTIINYIVKSPMLTEDIDRLRLDILSMGIIKSVDIVRVPALYDSLGYTAVQFVIACGVKFDTKETKDEDHNETAAETSVTEETTHKYEKEPETNVNKMAVTFIKGHISMMEKLHADDQTCLNNKILKRIARSLTKLKNPEHYKGTADTFVYTMEYALPDTDADCIYDFIREGKIMIPKDMIVVSAAEKKNYDHLQKSVIKLHVIVYAQPIYDWYNKVMELKKPLLIFKEGTKEYTEELFKAIQYTLRESKTNLKVIDPPVEKDSAELHIIENLLVMCATCINDLEISDDTFDEHISSGLCNFLFDMKIDIKNDEYDNPNWPLLSKILNIKTVKIHAITVQFYFRIGEMFASVNTNLQHQTTVPVTAKITADYKSMMEPAFW